MCVAINLADPVYVCMYTDSFHNPAHKLSGKNYNILLAKKNSYIRITTTCRLFTIAPSGFAPNKPHPYLTEVIRW